LGIGSEEKQREAYRGERVCVCEGEREKKRERERERERETETKQTVKMDDYFFKGHVTNCRNVTEETSYLEIFNYSVCIFVHKQQ
jgi:hypothetical protein